MYKHISNETKELLIGVQEKVEKKSALLDKKIERQNKDIDQAKKAKLSAKAINILKTDLKDTQKYKKFLANEGTAEILEQDTLKLRKEHCKSARKAFNAIDKLIGKTLNATVATELDNLKATFVQYEEQEKKTIKKIQNANQKTNNNASVLEKIIEVELVLSQQQFLDNIAAQVSAIKVLAKDNLAASNAFPLRTERAKLAPRCVQTAHDELSGADGFINENDDLESLMGMYSMFVSDARNHYHLGVEMLHGDPKKIDDAGDMDTASREGIDDGVYEFTRETIYDKDVFGKKAMEEHKEKVRLQDAQKLNKTIHKAIGSTKTSKRSSRKI